MPNNEPEYIKYQISPMYYDLKGDNNHINNLIYKWFINPFQELSNSLLAPFILLIVI